MNKGWLTVYDSTGNILIDIHKSDEYHGIIHTNDFGTLCRKVILEGDVGLGELYIEGNWTSPNMLELFMTFLINADQLHKKRNESTLYKHDDKTNIKHHYDVGNDFYLSFLTDDMHVYTCGFFFCPNDTLNDAQYNKIRTIMTKLEIEKDEKILDIGCGWGMCAHYIADKTGSVVDGVTLSDEQASYIQENIPSMQVYNMSYIDLPNDLHGYYDKIYSIGMFEHVKCSNYNAFFDKVHKLLNDNGRLVLHTITYSDSCETGTTCQNQNQSFVAKYIFPGGQIPKRKWIMDASMTVDLKLVHMEIYPGQHYGKTLQNWKHNLLENASKTKQMGYDEKLIKMYEFYFTECSASFFAGKMEITQFVFEKNVKLENVTYSKFQCSSF
jgi:cyclopropane-fatty-acyl-phospholipid synthase